jgi:hypothetical protein
MRGQALLVDISFAAVALICLAHEAAAQPQQGTQAGQTQQQAQQVQPEGGMMGGRMMGGDMRSGGMKEERMELKPAPRLEWQDQNGNQAEQHQHCTLTLGDSLTMRIRFSVHSVGT